ncbi:MAG: oligosaccharide flippase family protein, partial [Nitrososphaeria archaeon]
MKKLNLNDEFNWSVFTLSGGVFISQIIPILVSPILTRLYTPEDFGVFAIFVSITTILGVIVNGRYELAIMLPEKDEDSVNVLALAIGIACIISVLFLMFLIIFKKPFLKALKAENLGFWIHFAPLTIFFMGVFNALNCVNNRFKLYKDIAIANIYKALYNSVAKVVLGILKIGAPGLIVGQIISQVAANSKLFLNIKKTGLLNQISIQKIKYLAKEYINFPTFSVAAAMINALAYQLTNILMGTFFGQSTLGQYFLSQTLLGLPLMYIGSAVSQVFYQHAASELKSNSTIKITFKSTLKKLLYIGL